MRQQITLEPCGPYEMPSATLATPEEREALAFLLPLSEHYPGFDRWFITTVIPGIRNGTRKIVRLERGGYLIGMGIAKHDELERKICTVRIAGSHFGR